MGLARLDHYNIEVLDLEETVAFYCDVLGLRVGPRPPIERPGAWLYGDDDTALIHLLAPDGSAPVPQKVSTGCLHHIAIAATGKAQLRARLEAASVPFRSVLLPAANIVQFFLQDPNGINVEIQFPPGETVAEDRALDASGGV